MNGRERGPGLPAARIAGRCELRMNTPRNRKSERGGSLVEIALMCPWLFLLMVGVLDMGFYSYAAINTQNAARAAALALASGTTLDSQVCDLVRLEMRNMPNA